MKTVGEYLVQEGWITEAQLDQALAKQAQVGGRLGTCLVETGVLDETLLLKALSMQSGAPTATERDLADVPADAITRLPAKVAASHLAIPFRVFNNKVDVAVTDLGDLTRLDELAFVLGNRVQLHIAGEAVVRRALETYYQIPCPARFRHRPEAGAPRSGPAVAQPPAGPEPPAAPKPSIPAAAPAESEAPLPAAERRPRPQKKKSIPITAEEEKALWGEASQELPLSEELDDPGSDAGADFGTRLAAAERPEDVGAALLAALSEHFLRIVAFRTLRHRVYGWMHWGPEIHKDRLAHYSVSIEKSTVFREIQTSHRFFLGKLDGRGLHDQLVSCWGGESRAECMVFPVLVRERMACAVYCDRGPLGVAGVDIGAVRDLCVRAGLALERLILERKLRR